MCWRGDTRRDDKQLRKCRAAIVAHFAEISHSEADLEVAEIVGELLGNVHRYAPARFAPKCTGRIGARTFPHDCGPCFDPSDISSTDPADWDAERGRGSPSSRR